MLSQVGAIPMIIWVTEGSLDLPREKDWEEQEQRAKREQGVLLSFHVVEKSAVPAGYWQHLPEDLGPVVNKFRFTANPLIQGKISFSSGRAAGTDRVFPDRYLVAAMIL